MSEFENPAEVRRLTVLSAWQGLVKMLNIALFSAINFLSRDESRSLASRRFQ
jgi:hypothetical protein